MDSAEPTRERSNMPGTCKHCGNPMTVKTKRGKQRQVCDDSYCLGREWHDCGSRWLEQARANTPQDQPVKGTKLSAQDVREIRERYAKGKESYRKLGKEFGVNHMAIRDVVVGKSYQWVK